MSPEESEWPDVDHWAGWILRHWSGADDYKEARGRAAGRRGEAGSKLLDRILGETPLSDGQRVLDVGAGVGLLTLHAAQRVGHTGLVVALDVSADALCELRKEARGLDDAAEVELLAGDATALPVGDEAFDVVTTRSVLIYVRDKTAAAREFHRVLAPGGRACLFEPINKAGTGWADIVPAELAAELPGHARVVEYLRDTARYWDEMMEFDERDLTACFVDAGFADVKLVYEYHHQTQPPPPPADFVGSLLEVRPNPGSFSYAEAARHVLGTDAELHTEGVSRVLSTHGRTTRSATAVLRATKATKATKAGESVPPRP